MERHNLWCQSGFRLGHSVSSRSVQDSAARSMGPYLAALPVLPQDGVGNGLRGHHFFGQAGTNPKRPRFGQVVPGGAGKLR